MNHSDLGYCSALLAQLQRRYPGVEVTRVEVNDRDDGPQQAIRFAAPLDRLVECGLVTGAMVERRRRLDVRTPIGDGYSLHEEGGDRWALHVYTGSAPRERERFAVKDAERELRRFRLPRRGRR